MDEANELRPPQTCTRPECKLHPPEESPQQAAYFFFLIILLMRLFIIFLTPSSSAAATSSAVCRCESMKRARLCMSMNACNNYDSERGTLSDSVSSVARVSHAMHVDECLLEPQLRCKKGIMAWNSAGPMLFMGAGLWVLAALWRQSGLALPGLGRASRWGDGQARATILLFSSCGSGSVNC